MGIRFQEPKYNTNQVYSQGRDYYRYDSDTIGELAWREGATFRLMDWSDIYNYTVGHFDPDSNKQRLAESEAAFNRIGTQYNASGGMLSGLNEDDVLFQSSYYNWQTGKEEERSGEIITAEEANKQYGLDGRLSFDRDMTIAEAQILHKRKIKEMEFQHVWNTSEGWSTARGYVNLMGSALLGDPLNLVAAFATFGYSATFQIARAAKIGYGLSMLEKGAYQGLMFTGLTEIPIAIAKNYEQADYNLYHSMLNIAAGTAFSGGLHFVGGKTNQWINQIPADRHKAAFQLAQAHMIDDVPIRADVMIRAVHKIASNKYKGQIIMGTNVHEWNLRKEFEILAGLPDSAKIAGGSDLSQKETNKILLEDWDYLAGKVTNEARVSKTVGDFDEPPINIDKYPTTPIDDINIVVREENSQLGSNPGFKAQMSDGSTWYIKTPKSKEATANELAAGILYKEMTGRGPTVKPYMKNGVLLGIASKWKEGKPIPLIKIGKQPTAGENEILSDLVILAWLQSRDWKAPGNIIQDGAGRYNVIDHGGSLFYRAQGEAKPLKDFTPKTIWEDLIDLTVKEFPGQSAAAKAIATKLKPHHIQIGLQKLFALPDDAIDQIVQSMYIKAGLPIEQASQLTAMLKERRMQLTYGKWSSWMQDLDRYPAGWTQSKIRNTIGVGYDAADIAQKSFHQWKESDVIFKRFYSDEAAFAYINKQVDKYAKVLTKEERNAIRLWSKFSERTHIFKIKQLTGKEKTLLEEDNWHLEIWRDIQKRVNHLDSALKKIKIDMNFVFNSSKRIDEIITRGMDIENIKPGMTITTPSYMNGSLTGLKYSASTHDVNVVIRVPKGSNVIFLGKIGNFASEQELILPAGMQYIVRAFHRDGAHGWSKKYLLELELKPKDIIPPMGTREVKNAVLGSYENKSSTLTHGEVLEPSMMKLNSREEALKIEANPISKELRDAQREVADMVEDLTEEIGFDSMYAGSLGKIKEETAEAVTKFELVKQAYKAVKSCIIGKA